MLATAAGDGAVGLRRLGLGRRRSAKQGGQHGPATRGGQLDEPEVRRGDGGGGGGVPPGPAGRWPPGRVVAAVAGAQHQRVARGQGHLRRRRQAGGRRWRRREVGATAQLVRTTITSAPGPETAH